jgi:hypothetical protein
MTEMDTGDVFDETAWDCLLWAFHSARSEKGEQIKLRHLALGIIALHSRMATGQSMLLSSDSARTLLNAAQFSLDTGPPNTGGYIPAPNIDLPLAQDAADLISESVRAVGAARGAVARVGGPDFLRQLLLKLHTSVAEDSVSTEDLLRALITRT